MLCVFQYIDVLHVLMIDVDVIVIVLTPEQQGPELLTVCCEVCQLRQVSECADTWQKWIERTETVELCSFSYLSLYKVHRHW